MKKIIVSILIAVLIAALLLSSCTGGSTPEKGGEQQDGGKTVKPVEKDESPIAAFSANHSLTKAEMAYIFYGVFGDFYQNYSDYISYLGLDLEKSLKTQDCVISGGDSDETWFDYFMNGAHTYSEQYLVIAEAADAAGRSVTNSMRETVSNSMSQLRSVASDNGFSSIQEYLDKYYNGNGVTEEYIEKVLTLSAYATDYSREIYNSYTFTEEDIKEYCDKNLSDQTDYRYVNVRHILVDTEEEAKEILADILKAENVEEEFANTASEKTKDTGSKANGGLYENVYVGQMVPEFNDWCFDDSRKVGDTGIVKTDYGYHIMYFVGYGESYFESTAKTELRKSAYSRQFEAWRSKYPVTFNEELLAEITA